jgi:hypothetical protein
MAHKFAQKQVVIPQPEKELPCVIQQKRSREMVM